jgi:dihydrofolate reductase
LPNRTHIIITRDKNYKAESAIITHDLETAIAAASDDDQPFIIGGGEIYKQALDKAHTLELTRIHHVFEVDTYFPDFSTRKWELIKTEHHPVDEKHKYPFDYETWKRKS